MPRKFLTDIDLDNTSRVINLPTPTQAGHAASKAYVDSLVEGLSWKDSVRVATQANINLSSPGATIDGVTMVSGDRVLVRAQTTASQNGIYVWNGAAVALTRALDANTFAELEQAVVTVEEGTSAGSTFRQDQVNGTIDTSNVNWAAFGTAAPSASTSAAGIVRLATQTEVNSGTDATIAVTPATLSGWAGRIRKFASNLGDGTNTSYAITHNLNSRDVVVRVFPNSGSYDDVEVDVQRTDANTVTLIFAAAPAANAYRVVVIG